MGEYAEMALEGFVCECCGEWLGDDEGPGFPQRCAGCEASPQIEPRSKAKARKAARVNRERQSAEKKHPCPTCGRRFAFVSAVAQHARDKHGASPCPK